MKNFFEKLKRCRRIATRYDKAASIFMTFILLACCVPDLRKQFSNMPWCSITMNTQELLNAFRVSPEERHHLDGAMERDAALAADSERPLVAEINAKGWAIDSVWDLVNLHTDHAALAPILIAHLPKDYHPKVKMAIARALITANVRLKACSNALVDELGIAVKITGGQWEGVQQSLAHALAKLAHPAAVPAIEALAEQHQGTFLAQDLNEACKRVKRGKHSQCR